MCTVTVIPLSDAGFRLVSNRDEQRTRPPSSLPREHDASGVGALWPVDPTGGGTWIGANAHGLAMSLLNLNLDPHPALPSDPLSRGVVITSIIHSASAHEAGDLVTALALERMNCFRLVVADEEGVLLARWDRVALSIDVFALEPICFASSGLGDHLVQTRLPLWDEMVETHGATPETQDAFHAHAWPDRGLESVLMTREAARTTSTTVAEITREHAHLRHRDDDGWHDTRTLTRRASTPEMR